jgi:hypothetical protein
MVLNVSDKTKVRLLMSEKSKTALNYERTNFTTFLLFLIIILILQVIKSLKLMLFNY